ncbi:MAG: hypothetical protein ACFFCO_05130 [Promethearchaeota archaeon]
MNPTETPPPKSPAPDIGDTLSETKPHKKRWAIVRGILFTAFVSLIVSATIYYGQDIDPNLSIFFSAHIFLLIIFFAASLVITITRRLFSEEALLLFIILDALFLAYYSYTMVIHYFAVLFPAFIQYLAIFIAIGSVFLLFIGYALSSR